MLFVIRFVSGRHHESEILHFDEIRVRPDNQVRGWSLSGIESIRSGFNVYGLTIATANCNSSANNLCRPDLLRDPVLGGDDSSLLSTTGTHSIGP